MYKGRYRIDHEIIAELIESGSSVLDLGCGNGELLNLLIENKSVQGMGIEQDLEMVNRCLKKGIPVINANLDQGLSEYASKSFDYVVLSLTLQALKKPHVVVEEMLRIGKKAIVSFPNFGHIQVRLDIFFKGKMPKSEFLPYEWYDTPNIHFCSIRDFQDFCRQRSIRINRRIYLKKFNRRTLGFWPNLLSSLGIFVLEY